MDYETLRFACSGGIATITLDRPDNAANALNARMAEELFDVGVRCGAPEVRAVIVTVTAAGKMFCGGGDLAEMEAAPDKHAHLTRLARPRLSAESKGSWIRPSPMVWTPRWTARLGPLPT